MFQRYVARYDTPDGQPPASPLDTPVVVLPPRSRFEPVPPPEHKVQPAWNDSTDVHNTATERSNVTIETIEELSLGGEKQDGRTPALSSGRRASSTSPRNVPRGPPNSSSMVATQSTFPAPSSGGSLPPAPGRPSATRIMRGRPSSAAMAIYQPRRGHRPSSAPGVNPAGARGRLAQDMYALTVPGEELLQGPSSTALSTTTGKRGGAEQLQYELSVTASVLRAAQERLAKEREERQLARVGEELALVDVHRAREEARELAEERRAADKEVAVRMAEQRRALESELHKLESENAAAAQGMRAELDAKDARIRKLEREKLVLTDQLEDLQFMLEVADRALNDAKGAKAEVDATLKEERRTHHESVRTLQEQIALLEEGNNVALSKERKLRAQELDRVAAGAQDEAEKLLEREKEKRIEHLKSVAIRRIALKDLARGWIGWHDKRSEKRRRRRLLQQAANRLTRPKLSASYSLWRRDWQLDQMSKVGKTEKTLLREATAKANQLELELQDTRLQLAAAEQMLVENGIKRSERESEMQQALEAEKEKRVEHLKSVAIRRIALKDLARGWLGWHSMWSEKVRQRNLLKQAGARLTKPKLISSYQHWRHGWEAAKVSLESMSQEERLAAEVTLRVAAQNELALVREELEREKTTKLNGTGKDIEMQRRMEEELEREREKRVEHLKSVAIRRIALKDLARGWLGWHGMWSEKVRQRNLLKQAGARMTKPKLISSYQHWRKDWSSEVAKGKTMTVAQRLEDEKERHRETQNEMATLRSELSALRKAMLNGTGREAELKRLAEEELEREREKRVEHLKSVAIRRIALKDLARGWLGWHSMWSEKVRQRNLLKQAGARLTKPKLISSYQHWRNDWFAEVAAMKSNAQKAKLAKEKAARQGLETDLQSQVDRLTAELESARQAMLNGTGREAELKRLAEEQLEREREKRVEHLKSVAIRRIALKDLARGWLGWHGMWSEKVRQRNLLKQAGARLTKPKLISSYQHWRSAWTSEMAATATMTLEQQAAKAKAEREAVEMELRTEVRKLQGELESARQAMLNGTGREAELKRLAEEQLEREREKRVEHLKSVAIRRIALKDLARGWLGWHGMWSEKVRQRNLLKQAGARLTKPKLISSYQHWRNGWVAEMAASASMSQEQKYVMEMNARATAEKEVAKLRGELESARQAMLNGTGREAELKRAAEEELEREREKRVEHLKSVAIRRIALKDLARGWLGWHGMWSEKVRQRNLLKQAGARLTKPKLISSYQHWRNGWEADMAAQMYKTQEQVLSEERLLRASMEDEMAQLRQELERTRDLAMSGDAKEAEIARRLAVQREEERKERIANTQQRAARRVLNRGLTVAWTTWLDKYEASVYEKRILVAAAGRLTKPKLAAAYGHWRHDWDIADRQRSAALLVSEQGSMQEQMQRVKDESAKQLANAVKERDALLKKLSALDGGKAEAELELQRRLEEEKEKRVEHLKSVAIRRIALKDLARGWLGWHSMWSEKVRQRNLLKQAGARLTKPKLISSYQHWRRDWLTEMAAEAALTTEGLLAKEVAEKQSLNAEVNKLKKELESARQAMLNGTGREAELKRLAEEQLEREREKRVEHLKSVAIRRIALKDLARGWLGWHGMWSEKVRQRNLLKQAGARLTKPKLISSYQHWRNDWFAEVAAMKSNAQKAKLAKEKAARQGLETDLQSQVNRLTAELESARQAMLNGTGREAELKRLAEEQLEREREKRVEHLKSVAIRRIALKDLARGWLGWHGMWSEKVRQRNLLKQAGARLTKPKLISSYQHWRNGWVAEMAASASMSQEQKYVMEMNARATAEKEVAKLRGELESARQAMLNGTGREAELKRLAEEQLEREREKRVEHLKSVAIRRIALKDLARGWLGWHGMWSEKVRQRNLLKQAGARMTKPKLISSYQHWRTMWTADIAASVNASQEQRYTAQAEKLADAQSELSRLHAESAKRQDALTRERDMLLTKLSALDGGKAEAELELQRRLEEEKEKRVEHLKSVAIRRIALKDLARGWLGWHSMWPEKVRQRNLLKQAGARLTKPKLISSYQHWRRDWLTEMAAEAALTTEGLLAKEVAEKQSLNAEVNKLKKELESARQAMLNGTGREAELKRLAEEQLEREREKRVEHLKSVAIRRIALKDLARGWLGWHGMWSEKVRQRNLLKQAGARLTKPKLISSYQHWRTGWTEDVATQATMTQERKYVMEMDARREAEMQLSKALEDLAAAREAMLSGHGQEVELRRLAEEKLEREREKRVEHLKNIAIRRIALKDLARGWLGWHGMWSEKVRQRNLLKQAGARLTKPKLISSYQHWRTMWTADIAASVNASQEQRYTAQAEKLADAQSELSRLHAESAKRQDALTRERDMLLTKLSALDGGKAEAELELQRRLEEEKEKRVEHLKSVAIRRIALKDLARGWLGWHSMWSEKVRQRNLLKQAGARLTKPKLISSYQHWRNGWVAEMAQHAAQMLEQKLHYEEGKRGDLTAQIQKLQGELESARQAMLNGTGREAELKRLAEEELEREREKRVEHLKNVAIRRIALKDLARGWLGWHGMWSEKVRQRNLLKQAGTRMTKPKMVASYHHWHYSWTVETSIRAAMSQEQRLNMEIAARKAAEVEVGSLQSQLSKAREDMLSGHGQEAELRRLAEEKLEREKEKRIEHLKNVAIRRIALKDMARGWLGWHGMWSEKVNHRNLLKKAAARLTKPKLVSSYQLWRGSWEMAAALVSMSLTQEQKLRIERDRLADAQGELNRVRIEAEKKLGNAAKEREVLLAKLSNFDGGAAKRASELEAKLEEERDKRIEHLRLMAARRMGQRDMTLGWTAWFDLWSAKVEQRRLLQAAAGRMMKPKMAHAYSAWRHDWDVERHAALSSEASSQMTQLAASLDKATAAEAEARQLREELESARFAMLSGHGREAELQRVAEEQLHAEREARIAHLHRMAGRRLGRRELSRGWTAWSELFLERRRQLNTLRAVSTRLAKPKLARAYVHWRLDWDAEVMAEKARVQLAKMQRMDSHTSNLQADMQGMRSEYEEKVAMFKAALEEQREAAMRQAEELSKALRGAYKEQEEVTQAKKAAEEALEAERQAKKELAKRRERDAEAAAIALRKHLDEQRVQLEKESLLIRNELLAEIESLRAKLNAKPSRPPPVQVAPLLEYDPNKSVAEALRDLLARKNMRVMDLFRDFDEDASGEIDRKEWVAAFTKIGPDYPTAVVIEAFDDFDPDSSGTIEFSELEKFLKKRATGGWKKAADKTIKKSIAGVVKQAKALTPDVTDVEGLGRGEFSSNMQIKADDFFNADQDGNTELEFNEFKEMVRMRSETDGTPMKSEEELVLLFKQLDLDGSGTVDLSEYIQWGLQQAIKESKGRVLDLFREWDDDKSGFVDVNEFHKALREMGFPKCTKKDAAAVFRALDPDNSGKLDYRELNAALRKIQKRGYAFAGANAEAAKKRSPGTGGKSAVPKPPSAGRDPAKKISPRNK